MSASILRAPVRVAAEGMYAPLETISNADLEALVETSDEWIVQRTGIRTRHKAAENEYTSDLCMKAIEDLQRAHPGVRLADVDYVIAATTTPDYVYPSIAALVQDKARIPRTAGAIDISAACAGFCSALNLAAALVAAGQARKVLILAGETLTRSIDYTDRATCVLFGDGAAAMIVEYDERWALAGMSAGSDGSAGPSLYRTATRTEIAGIIDETGLLRQTGREIYRWVMENVPGEIERILRLAGMTLAGIDWFIPHSANMRMIEALCKRIDFPLERTLTSVEEYGNTSAVSVPLALIPAVRDGRVKAGDRILLIGFGGGLVSAGAVLTWTP